MNRVHMPIVCWLPAAIAYAFLPESFDLAVLVSLALYGVLIVGIIEEAEGEE